MQYTEGDWVIANSPIYPSCNGQLGKIIRIEVHRGCPYAVKFDNGQIRWLLEKELELAGPDVLAIEPQIHDPVASPAHYTGFSNGAEPIDIAEHLNYNRGNAVKYLVRAGRKDDEEQDLRKALFYLMRELKRMRVEV
ncbi:hypothetical protein GCM10020221_11490 [Streptomyces thioluteus]|uniref:DUF3310 domain-containing protein n=1 Tax=Streptomyces thioluteus TaxID=66431 RepID=A0ABP6J1D9_STRTU